MMTDMENEHPKLGKLSQVFLLIYFTLMLYAFVVMHVSNMHEGIWEILFNFSSALIMPGLLVSLYLVMRYDPEKFFSEIKLMVAAVGLIGLTLFFFEEIKNGLYNSLFEKTKTAVSTQYTTHIREIRGIKEYYLYFEDDNQADDCDPQYQKCPYDYKVRINFDTFLELNLLSSRVKKDEYNELRNPSIELSFKPKAEILMECKTQPAY